ncbi:MAG: Wzz/FepE/Etk N-terminal domain-containing protein [Bryobacteraceae bacterium]|jgi:polysaccharide chain length determinant protein (PEP-CTERM system associated)
MSVLQIQVGNSAMSPRSIIRALWKWKAFIAVLWAAGIAGSLLVVCSLPRVYISDALILVESQKIPENFVVSTVQTGLEARLDELKQQVLSRERLWTLIQELNLYPALRKTRTRAETLEAMRHDIAIGLERGWSANRPGAFRVSYRAFSPKVAAEVANRVGNFFITENLREREQEANGTSQFLESQLDTAKTNLQEQEAKLREFKTTYNGELPEQEIGMLAANGQNKAELLGIQDSIGRAQQNKLILAGSLAMAEDSVNRLRDLARRRATQDSSSTLAAEPGQPAPQGPRADLERVRAKLRDLRLRYRDSYPDVQSLLQEQAGLEKAVHDEADANAGAAAASNNKNGSTAAPPANSDPALVTEKEKAASLKQQIALTDREIGELEKRRERVLRDVGAVQSRMDKLPMREQQLASLTRDYEASKANYKSLLDKKLAAEMAANMERWQKAERFVMLDVARVPEKPASPNLPVFMAGGVLLSLALAAGIAFLLETGRNVFLGEWELPAGTVVLGRVPKMLVDNPQV